MAKTPAQLDREIAEALAGKSQRSTTGRTTHHARVAKTKLLWVVQGNYGYGHGWEDVTAEEDWKEAKARLREYRENEPGVPFRTIRRRERIEPAAQTAHARKRRLSHDEAKRLLESEGVDFTRGYYESVPTSQSVRIAEVAKMAGYRKSKNAPGSTGRMYYQYLSRLR